jgi:hypothetical protein
MNGVHIAQAQRRARSHIRESRQVQVPLKDDHRDLNSSVHK